LSHIKYTSDSFYDHFSGFLPESESIGDFSLLLPFQPTFDNPSL
jgi:hypothetical protein